MSTPDTKAPTVPPPAPPRKEGAAVVGGLALTGCLHVVVSIVIIIVGTAWNAGEVVLVFWVGIGIAQWVYMLPAALLAKRVGRSGLAKGLWIGAALGTMATALCWGGIAVTSLIGAASQHLPQSSVTVPSSAVDVQGTVVSVTPSNVVVRQDDGATVTVVIWPQLEYILLKANGGYEKTTFAAVVPGARVSIDAYRGSVGISASIFRIVGEGRTMPSPGGFHR